MHDSNEYIVRWQNKHNRLKPVETVAAKKLCWQHQRQKNSIKLNQIRIDSAIKSSISSKQTLCVCYVVVYKYVLHIPSNWDSLLRSESFKFFVKWEKIANTCVINRNSVNITCMRAHIDRGKYEWMRRNEKIEQRKAFDGNRIRILCDCKTKRKQNNFQRIFPLCRWIANKLANTRFTIDSVWKYRVRFS